MHPGAHYVEHSQVQVPSYQKKEEEEEGMFKSNLNLKVGSIAITKEGACPQVSSLTAMQHLPRLASGRDVLSSCISSLIWLPPLWMLLLCDSSSVKLPQDPLNRSTPAETSSLCSLQYLQSSPVAQASPAAPEVCPLESSECLPLCGISDLTLPVFQSSTDIGKRTVWTQISSTV